jgi:DeoR family transcriptional regulator of aga operon
VIAVADSSKIGMISPHKVCEAAQIDTIITDDNVAPELVERFRRENIHVLCV